MKLTGWKCTRCGNYKSQGCGMPNYTVPVHYEDGTVEQVRPACPLAPIGLTRIYMNLRLGSSVGRAVD